MVSDRRNEKLLAIFYPLIILFSFVTCVTMAVAWNHWKYVLDTCVEWNCGCILKGISTITYFNGGHVAYCHWATFGLIIPICVAAILGCYHVFRVCCSAENNRRTAAKHSIRQRSGDIIVMTARSEVSSSSGGDGNGVSPYFWVPATIASCFMAIYSLVHAAMLLDGVLTSCSQYRNELIKYMGTNGQMVQAIQGRLTCATVFDFMDYLHQDIAFDRRRFDRINTAVCLVLAMLMSWMAVALWISVFVINVIQARRSRKLRI